MLKRFITGSLLAILAILAIIFIPIPLFITASTLLILFAAWEWGLLMGIKKYTPRLIYILCIAVLMYSVWYIPLKISLWVALFWWSFAVFLIISYPNTSFLWGKSTLKRALMGILVLVPSWLVLNQIRMMPQGVPILLFLLLIIWSADTGAYFAGKRWGKHFLLPAISPKKTKEGIIGAFALSLCVAIIGCLFLNLTLYQRIMIIVLSFPTTFFSIVGDLFESMLKRQVGIKDTGNYLPGHGGLLDRIDSLTAAAPIFLFGLLLFT